MRKGIIMDMNERFLTLLTPDGEFLKINRQKYDYEIGQEIPIPIQEKPKATYFSFFNSLKGKSLAAVAIASILALITFIPFNQNEVYAYMSIDVNPSIELGVNEDLKVIELIPYNESGKKLIEELENWKKKDLKSLTEEIMASLKGNGYLNTEKEIVIGTVHTGEAKEKVESKLDEAIKEIEENISDENAKVTSYEATEKERELALQKGLTAGKLISEQNSTQSEKAGKSDKQTQPKETPKAQNPIVNNEQNGVTNKVPANEAKKNENPVHNKKIEKPEWDEEKFKNEVKNKLQEKHGEVEKIIEEKANELQKELEKSGKLKEIERKLDEEIEKRKNNFNQNNNNHQNNYFNNFNHFERFDNRKDYDHNR
ncbi:anti-sigma factor domain-containing protein [Robertmurraya yapensis]|uniref:Anti-sigma factor domain-containing protein n=1 Tax=Bacillus yapensis TaxID=2492960 RepID=A0A3S0KQR0_9BACI|nr:anti-sigma factor domain-containing protein [Bacillus yapensis]RTR32319.1 anti-sigma factor domain-containing protein [Bacillus yapensis]TKS96513.1 anti-sigma factor domain-containing protein [Bacillus yapensis]